MRNPFKKSRNRKSMTKKYTAYGHDFYVFTNPLTMKKDRLDQYRVQSFSNELRVNHQILTDYLDKSLKMINQQDIAGIAAGTYYMKTLVKQFISQNQAFNIAALVILIDDEPEDLVVDSYMETKQRLFDKYSDIRDFFLSVGLSLADPSIENLKDSEHWDYLKSDQARRIEIGLMDWIKT